jgi:hypothetical protein
MKLLSGLHFTKLIEVVMELYLLGTGGLKAIFTGELMLNPLKSNRYEKIKQAH